MSPAWFWFVCFIGVLWLLVIACGGNHNLATRYRAIRRERDTFAGVCEQLTAELREADHLAIQQARKSLEQQERIAEIEARELPQLQEIRDQYGRTLPTYSRATNVRLLPNHPNPWVKP